MACKHVLAQCPHLQTLQLDIIVLPSESPKFQKRELRVVNHLIHSMGRSPPEALEPCEETRVSRAANEGLRQIVITGLRANFCGLLAVIHASRLLADGGKLGVGMGSKGRRFKGMVHERYVILESLPEPSLTWLDFQDIGRWVEENCKEYDPHGICGKLTVNIV